MTRHLYDNQRVVAVYYTVTLKLHYCDLLWIGFVVQLVSTADKILTDTANLAIRLW